MAFRQEPTLLREKYLVSVMKLNRVFTGKRSFQTFDGFGFWHNSDDKITAKKRLNE